jgi:drug/metabolite transporter (DMT)-like permease
MFLILGQLFALLTALCWAQNSLVYSYLGKKVGSDAVTHIRLWLAFLFRAFVEIGAREALVVMTTSPVFSLIFSWIIFKETLSIIKIASILVILGGVIWVIFAEKSDSDHLRRHNLKGMIYAFLGALTQAIGLIFAKKGMMDGVHPVTTNMIRIAAGFLGLILYSVLKGTVVADFKVFKYVKLFIFLLFAVVVGPVLGIILSLYALNWAPVGIVTTLMQVSPIMLLPVDIFILKKKVSMGAVLGTFLAVGGVVLLFLY